MTTRALHLSPALTLPPEAVTQTFAILAKRGAGKTYTAAVLVEELLKAGLQAVIVDPVGVWWGLRASADGQREGLPIVIFGGDHADVPLEPGGGKLVADLVVDERLSCILDLSLLRKGQQTAFMTDFAETLYHRNRAPLHLVLDEADAFAPQRPMKGQERLLGAIEDLVRRGRARGLGVTLVTQRAAVLNKDVLTQAEVLVALRTIAPQDREAIDAWVRVHGTPEQREELMASLPSLPIGTAWIWSPGWLDVFQRVDIRRKETFDSSATPTVGAVRLEPKALAPVDLERLRERLAAVIDTASLDDPRALRRRIAELEQAQKPQPLIERIEVPVLPPEQIAQLQALGTNLRTIADAISTALVKAQGRGPTQELRMLRTAPDHTRSRVTRDRVQPPPTALTRPAEAATVRHGADVHLRAGERHMLETLARRVPLRVTRAQLGTLAGFTPSGGTFGTYLGTLKREGLIEEHAGELHITPTGLASLGYTTPPAPQTTAEVLAMWRAALRAGERTMLDILVAKSPAWISREALAAQSGYEVKGGTFGTYLGTLRRNGLIEIQGGQVRASPTLFLAEGSSPC